MCLKFRTEIVCTLFFRKENVVSLHPYRPTTLHYTLPDTDDNQPISMCVTLHKRLELFLHQLLVASAVELRFESRPSGSTCGHAHAGRGIRETRVHILLRGCILKRRKGESRNKSITCFHRFRLCLTRLQHSARKSFL